jgi:IMP cyclohydrolase
VVGNGDHVTAVHGDLTRGRDIYDIMATISVEPDPPIYTPRIWIAVRTGDPATPSMLGHVRQRRDGGITRSFASVSDLPDGHGVLLSTYDGTPENVTATNATLDVTTAATDPESLLDEVWRSLDERLRVAAMLLTPDKPELRPLTRIVPS